MACDNTSLLKIGTPKNREFWEISPFSQTCDFLKIMNFEKIGNFKKSVTLAIPEYKRTCVYELGSEEQDKEEAYVKYYYAFVWFQIFIYHSILFHLPSYFFKPKNLKPL